MIKHKFSFLLSSFLFLGLLSVFSRSVQATSWVGPTNPLTSDQIVQTICNHLDVLSPSLIQYDSSIQKWRVSLTREALLQYDPNCPETGLGADTEIQHNSIGPRDETVFAQAYNSSDSVQSHRVMAPGRKVKWTGLAINPSFTNSDTVAIANWGFQTGEADSPATPSTFRSLAVTFAWVKDDSNTQVNTVINGGLPSRPHMFIYDFTNGLTYESYLGNVDPQFYTSAHNYEIDWTPVTGHFLGDANKPQFSIIFKIDNQVVGQWDNGTVYPSITSAAYIPCILKISGVCSQVGVNTLLVAPRWIQITTPAGNPRVGGVFTGTTDYSSSLGDAANVVLPKEGVDEGLTFQSVEIADYP